MLSTVLISPPAILSDKAGLWAALSEWLNIDFVDGSRSGEDEIIFCSSQSDIVAIGARRLRRRLVFVRDGSPVDSIGSITFSQSGALPIALRGQKIPRTPTQVLPVSCRGEVLAGCEAGPLWVRHEHAGQRTDFVSDDLQELGPDELLHDQIASMRWTGLLPLIEFLRSASAEQSWVSPPLRACFMFDDPNLHWTRYGFLDFRMLVRHAEEHYYHAAMATVPFDAWGVSSKATGLFQTHSAHLSLLIHGNNHTQSELAQPYPDETRKRLVAQSLQRISRLERRIGSSVPKVMAAPHGACSEPMARELLRQGYEAACISWGSLRKHNPHKVWSPAFGLEPAEFLAGGLPVIPRFRMSRECLPDVVLSAFLGQPIIPVGHHQDVAGGLDLLAQVSGMINRLGQVRWCDMSEIARTNFKTRVRGNVLEVRMYSRLIRIHAPAGITRLSVERAWDTSDEANERLEARFDGGEWTSADGHEVSIPRPETGGGAIDLRFTFGAGLDYRTISSPAFRSWPVIRRILAEARDRVQPMIQR